jgi:hypothetical protein
VKKYLFALFILIIFTFSQSLPLQSISASMKIYDYKKSHAIFNDSFESYSDWLTIFPKWNCIDVNGDPTIGHSYYNWPHEGEPFAFIVFDPSNTTPSMNIDPGIQPHTGNKFVAGFNNINFGYTNDDWLITPQLSSSEYSNFSFWAKSYSNEYNLEEVTVGISTSPNPDNMTLLCQDSFMIPSQWVRYTFNITNWHGNIYLGIHMVSADSWILMIDDFEVTGNGNSDFNPPITTCTLTGTIENEVYISNVQTTLTATDDNSGVDYTMYKVDDAPFTTYTSPFYITTDGDHIITYYSVDKFGNTEEQRTTTFKEQHLISITDLKGGLGITTTLKNNADGPMVVSYSVTATGFVHPERQTKEFTLNPGTERQVRTSLFGIGKTHIDIETGWSNASANIIVVLFFVLGIN